MCENKQLRVLLVDDDEENLQTLKESLRELNVCVVKAKSGRRAIDYLMKNDVFLSIINVDMEEMNGFQLAEGMRNNEKTRNIPIVFMTSDSKEQKYIFRGYQLGAVDYLFKPVNKFVLTCKIKLFIDIYEKNYQLKKKTILLESKVEELIQLRESNYKLEKLSFYDSLTGLENRRRFDQILNREWNRAIREQKELSIIMLDVDNFKSYNDNYGHINGDECLKRLAKSLLSTVKRSCDSVARYGGEEFIVLLPSTHNKGAIEVAENIRKNIEAMNIVHEYSGISNRLTVSLGVNTVIPSISTSQMDFIEKADQALYSAKHIQKNIVSNALEQKVEVL